MNAWSAQQSVFHVEYSTTGITRTPVAQADVLNEVVAFGETDDEDTLTFTSPGGATKTYRRLDHIPHKTRIERFGRTA